MRAAQELSNSARAPHPQICASLLDATPDQMSLPGLGAASALFQPDVIRSRPGQLSGYNLFWAILPQDEDAERFALVGAKLRAQHGLQGQCLRTERLHTTLHTIAGFKDATPQSYIDAAKAAAASVSCPPFPIVFNRAGSFSNNSNPDDNAFVLRCDARSTANIAMLRQALALALRRSGLHPRSSSTPHMTMLYDRHVIPEHPIEPLCWTATRFALILSHQGLEYHQQLGCWQLA